MAEIIYGYNPGISYSSPQSVADQNRIQEEKETAALLAHAKQVAEMLKPEFMSIIERQDLRIQELEVKVKILESQRIQ